MNLPARRPFRRTFSTRLLIPARAHLIWLGRPLPALAYLAVRSAMARGGFDEVILHHDDPELADDPLVRNLSTRPGFVPRRIEAEDLATRDMEGVDSLGMSVLGRLGELSERLSSPASRSNLHRLAILWLEGGVYIDTDVVVLQKFDELRRHQGFAGLERICFPLETVQSRNPLRWARAGVLTTAREGIARFTTDPGAVFRRVEWLYPAAANNAVVGARPAHPLLRDLLVRASNLPTAEATRRFRLGPRLLQEATNNESRPDFELLPPAVFYPLPPEVCRAYVRDDPGRRLGDLRDGATVAAHVYDSNLRRHLRQDLDADHLRAARGRTLLARMTEPYLDDLFAALSSQNESQTGRYLGALNR